MVWMVLGALVIVVAGLAAFWALVLIKPEDKKHHEASVPTTNAIPRQLPEVGRHYIDQTAEMPAIRIVPPRHSRA